jgi:glycosyltransferase involved in cell wall biosynthesis
MLFPVLLLRRLCSHTPILLLHIETNVVDVGGRVHTLAVSSLDILSTKLASILFDKILFISPMMGRLYQKTRGISASKIAVWPSSVEANFANSVDETKTALLRKELGLAGRTGFLYHGTITKGRGVIELVEAFRILREWSVNATLVLLGYGPQKEAVSEYIRTHHLDEVVKLLGPVDHSEVPRYIAACDVGIVPLPDHIWWRYQCPIKVLEFLAMNKPLIVSDIPGHRWIIGNKPVALYLKGTDPHAIADGVRGLLSSAKSFDPTLGKRIVEERFTPERIADVLESQILSLMYGSSHHTTR